MDRNSEDRRPDIRRYIQDEEDFENHEVTTLDQSLETLREDYQWIPHFERLHPGYDFVRFEEIPLVEDVPELADAAAALITTSGIYLEEQKSFSISPGEVEDRLRDHKFRLSGDASYRLIPASTEPDSLRVSYPEMASMGAFKDINVVFPISRLNELVEESFIGSVAENHVSFMGYLPEPSSLHQSIPQVISQLEEDQVDLAVLLPGDVLSHQTLAIVQNAVEESGIPTVSVTLCRDLSEYIGVPRAVHYRFPFGYTFGEPYDQATQLRILKDTLRAFREVEEPNTIIDLPYQWVVG